MQPTARPDTVNLDITRQFSAPPERVFDAFASIGALKKWFGPADCQVTDGSVDLRVGGGYHMVMQTGEYGVVELDGTYREIDRPHRLAFSWKWSGNPEVEGPEMEVVLTFASNGEGGTELHLHQTGFGDAESQQNHDGGWNGTFEKLEVLFVAGAGV